MTSISQALAGFAPAHAQSRQHARDGNSEDTNFGEMVHGVGQRGRPQGKDAAEPASAETHPGKRAAVNPDKAPPGQDAEVRTVSRKPAEKNTKGNADRAKADDDDTGPAARTSDAAPFQDRLPLQMALSDIQHFAASPNGDRGKPVGQMEAATGAFAATSAPPRLVVLHDKRASADEPETTEPALRSGHRATESGPDFGQKRASIEPGPDLLVRKGDVQPSMQDTGTDAAPPRAWRPAALSKAGQTAQAATSLEQARPPASAGRMDVVGQQSFPAPAQQLTGQTGAALVDAIAGDSGVQSFASASVASQTTNSVAVPTHVLKIELHPAELGMVTASLRLAGEQLSIEMKPETHEAYRRLTADSDAIVKSLRGLGFDVDKVAILQPSIAVHAAGRADASNATPMPAGRDQPSFQSGNSGGNNTGGDRQPGRNDGNGAQEFGRAASPLRERAGDDMYI